MAEYYNVTTNLGDAEIANAIATNTKLNITHIAFGDGNGSVPTPNKARTSLVREVHRQAVTKYERHATNANWIVIETIIPSSIGGFWVREMGIIANGKLISHGSHAPFEKVADPSGVSEYRLRFTQNVTDGSVVEIMLDESLIYASQAWVEENFIKRSEIVDDLTTNDSNKPVSAKQAKVLQDNKLDKNSNAVSATKLKEARTIAISGAVTGTATGFDGSANIAIATTAIDGSKISSGTVPVARLPAASTSAAGAVKLNNTLTSTSTTEALTAAQGKVLNGQMFGVGQSWKDVTSERVANTWYTNTLPKVIFLTVTVKANGNNAARVAVQVETVNGEQIEVGESCSRYGSDYKSSFIGVPVNPNEKYKYLNVEGGISVKESK
ncbi:MAG: phage tail protein [Acinetobacter sp.]|uniref:phage tail protein n=1 Tax=Acinetobacter sp. TaxID=472 RepID=UPI003D05F153